MKLERALSSLTTVIFILSLTLFILSPIKALALTQAQIQSYAEGAIYFDTNVSSCSPSTATSTASSGAAKGENIYILGDSITAQSKATYKSSFQGLGMKANIDTQTGLSLNEPGLDGTKTTGMQAILQDKNQISTAGAIIIGLGTYGGDTNQAIDKAIAAIRALNQSAPIFWIDTIVVNNTSYDPIIQQANQAIYSQAGPEKYTVISWFKTVYPSGNPQHLTGTATDSGGYIDSSPSTASGLLPSTPKGVNALVNLVVNTVTGDTSSPTKTSISCCTGTNAMLTGNTNPIKAYNFYVQNGFTAVQAAGIVGNMMYESGGVDPTKIQAGGDSNTPSGQGWGIVQFTPPSKATAIAAAAGITTPIYQLSTQLQIILDQLNGKAGSFNETAVKTSLMSATTVQLATTVFQDTYERPANLTASLQDRINYAQQLLGFYPATSSGAGSTTTVSFAGCSSSSNISGYQNPFRSVSDLKNSRVDMGVDLLGNGPIYAIGNGVVVGINQGWCTRSTGGCNHSEPLLGYKLTSGAGAGKDVYVAECITPMVSAGQQVTSNTIIATMTNNTSCNNGIETGWLNPNLLYTTMATSCFTGSNSTAYGENFSQLLTSLGSKGGNLDLPATCSLPPEWPTWQ